MRVRLLRLVAVALLATWGCRADGADALRPCFANLTDDARKELGRCARAGAAWHPAGGRTKMFIRGQFYYGNQYAHYIHDWYERPLHQDSSMATFNEPGRMLNEKSWRRTVQTAREMKLDGFAFFPLNAGCMDLFPRSLLAGAEVTLLMQFTSSNIAKSFDECVRLAERYRSAPNAYRIGGRPVIVGYPEIFVDDARTFANWKRYRQTLARKFGSDAFIVMPCVRLFDLPDLDRSEMDGAVIRKVQQRVRDVLHEMDGLFIGQWEVSWGDPRNLSVPTDEIVTPVVRSVLCEPEFAGKHLGYEFYQAHENPYRRVSDIPSGGITRLKSALDSIEKLQPDFAFGSEWDEENENVHFRPTVSNGQTTQRVMRYYADRMSGMAPTPYPGDDVSIPNLIVCYRKMLAVGEPAEVQVVGVPDGTQPGEFSVSFRWLTVDGKPVRSFSPQRLSMSSCAFVSFVCSSVELAQNQVLRPELTVIAPDGQKRVYEQGLWPMSVDAIRVLDNKWVRQSLREICTGVSGSIEIGARGEDGLYEIRGAVKGPRKFRSIEVLETSDSVYMHDSTDESTPTDGTEVFVRFKALPNFWRTHSPTGWVRLLNAPRSVPVAGNKAYAVSGGPREWLLPKRSVPKQNFFSSYGFRVPSSELDGAELEFALPSVLDAKRLRVADVIRKGPYSFALPGGGQAVVMRRRVRPDIPPPVDVDSAEFSFRLKPLDPTSVLRLQVVDEDYRIWRGPVAAFTRPSGTSERFHVYDEVADRSIGVKLDRSRLYALKYDFGNCCGDMVNTCGGRLDSPCVFGGSVSLVTGVGAGGCWYQHALSEANPDFIRKSGGDDTAPRCVHEPDGSWSLVFTNSNFATLPMQFVPRHAGFKLSMRVWPDRIEGEQWLLDSGNLGFRLLIRNGVPEAFLCCSNEMFRRGVNATAGITVRGPTLKRGEWNDLTLTFDQAKAVIEVNGVAGESVEGCGYEGNPHATAFGCSVTGNGFFGGRVSGLRIRPY